MIRNCLLIVVLLMEAVSSGAQEKSLVRKGNELYQKQRYKEAAATYMQALQKNPSFVPGSFNLGNALIQQKQYEAARKVLESSAKMAKDKPQQSGAAYNIGNTWMTEQKWQEAVDAYKQALRKNPQDADAKYNLSYALAKLKQQQQNGGGKDKNKDQKNKDQQNKDQDKGNNKDKQDQQNKDKDKGQNQDKKDQDQKSEPDKQDKEDQHPEPQPSKLSKQQADNLLNALQQDERKLHDKLQKGKGVPVKVEKDW